MKYLVTLLLFVVMTNLSFSARSYFIYDTKASKEITFQEMVSSSLNSQIVFFGEFHDDSLIHALQYDFFKAFHSGYKNTALSMEMFERDVQDAVNEYLTSPLDDTEFLKKSRPWPDYKKFYKPMVDYSKENGLPVIASNIPRKYAAMFVNSGFTGLRQLPPHEQNFITQELILREDEYMFKFFETMLGDRNEIKTLNPNKLNTLYLYYGSQCIKDETMAESIINFLNEKPDYKVVHLNGDFHSNSFLGTVQKVWQRNAEAKLKVITPIYFKDKSEIKYDDLKKEADFVIFLTEPVKEAMPEMAMTGAHFGENYVEKHQIKLKISPETSSITGSDVMKFKNPIIKKSSVKLLKSLEIKSIKFKEQEIIYNINSVDELYNEIIFENAFVEERRFGEDHLGEVTEITIEYEGKIYNKPSETNLIQRHSNSSGIISSAKNEGIYLPGGSFYPKADKDLANFNAEIEIPTGYSLITTAINTVSNEEKYRVYTIQTENPIDDLVLVGGKFIENTKIHDNIAFKLHTYDSTNLSENYLNAAVNYYDLYTPLFGKYPFKEFSIVENFFATGFGMPGYTLLSGKLLTMPWVTLSPGSLAHEFVHNWWGNGVFVDYEAGNWCEALTTFSTNYYLNILTNKPNEALDWRKKSLIALDALPADRNYPVKEFKYQQDTYDAVVGYQKGAFIFLEIMKLMGDESFFKALKSFAEKNLGKRAFWMTLASAFDAQAKIDSIKYPIRKTFNSWINSKDIPVLSLENVVKKDNITELTVRNQNKFLLKLPVAYKTMEGIKKEYFVIEDTVNKININLPEDAEYVQIDPDYEVLRKLYAWEKPYSFNRTLNSEPIVVLPDKSSQDYAPSLKFMDMLKESGYNFKSMTSAELTPDIIKNNSLILLGSYETNKEISNVKAMIDKYVKIENGKLLLKNTESDIKNHVALLNIDHSANSDKLMTVIYFSNLSNADTFKRLFHYLSYSYLVLDNNKPGKPIQQGEIFPGAGSKSEMVKYLK